MPYDTKKAKYFQAFLEHTMNLRQLFEGIRMGSRDISFPTAKQYTIGFEFEVSAIPSFEDEFDVAYEDEEDAYQAYSSWWYNGGSVFDFAEWFNNNYYGSDKLNELIRDYEIEPRYGSPTSNDYDDPVISFYDQDGTHLTTDEITSLDELIEYFDTDEEEIRDITSDEWGEAESELFGEEYTRWRMTSDRIGGYGPSKFIDYVADELKKYVKRPVSVSETFSKTEWTVGSDGTAGVDAEIRSPIMNLEESFGALTDMFKFLNSGTYATTSTACGLHVNIGTWTMQEIYKIDWLKFLILLYPEKILSTFTRINNRFVYNNLPQLVRKLQSNQLKNYEEVSKTMSSIIISERNKNLAVNFNKLKKFGYIEIRAPGGHGYQYMQEQLQNNILTAIRAIEIAGDPNAYKNTYLSKLYKLMDKFKLNYSSRYVKDLNKFVLTFDRTSTGVTPETIISDMYKIIDTDYNPDYFDDLYNDEIKRELYGYISRHNPVKSDQDSEQPDTETITIPMLMEKILSTISKHSAKPNRFLKSLYYMLKKKQEVSGL